MARLTSWQWHLLLARWPRRGVFFPCVGVIFESFYPLSLGHKKLSRSLLHKHIFSSVKKFGSKTILFIPCRRNRCDGFRAFVINLAIDENGLLPPSNLFSTITSNGKNNAGSPGLSPALSPVLSKHDPRAKKYDCSFPLSVGAQINIYFLQKWI
jgi:hypothetical protein